jgi:hypothetical protein
MPIKKKLDPQIEVYSHNGRLATKRRNLWEHETKKHSVE